MCYVIVCPPFNLRFSTRLYQKFHQRWSSAIRQLWCTRLKPLQVKGFNVFKFFRHEQYKFLSNQSQIIIDFKQKFYYLYIWLKLSTPPSWCALLYTAANTIYHRIVSLRQRWQNGHFRICPPLILRLIHFQTLRHIQKRLHVPVARYRLARCLDINIFSPGAAAE